MNVNEIEVRVYRTVGGACPFEDWLDSLKDQATRCRIDVRIARLRLGNIGDAKAVGGGVHELRLSFGSGYRVYYGRDGARLVILLTGGDKRRQSADIRHARLLWQAYLQEKTHAHD